jgi:hypothetical protein
MKIASTGEYPDSKTPHLVSTTPRNWTVKKIDWLCCKESGRSESKARSVAV